VDNYSAARRPPSLDEAASSSPSTRVKLLVIERPVILKIFYLASRRVDPVSKIEFLQEFFNAHSMMRGDVLENAAENSHFRAVPEFMCPFSGMRKVAFS